MNAITAVTAAKSTIDRLLSNGNASATSGLIKSGQRNTLAYTEQFSGPEISVDYRHNGKEWEYKVATDDLDSAFFFGKTGTARTLKEARLEALDAVVAGCAAQPEKAENRAKEWLLKLMTGTGHQNAVNTVLGSVFLPNDILRRWQDITLERFIKSILGRSGCQAWESWASNKWLSCDDRSQSSAEDARFIAAWHGCGAAQATARCASLAVGLLPARQYALEFAEIIASHAEDSDAELKRQHRDLLALINEM